MNFNISENKWFTSTAALFFLACLCIAYATFYALYYADQPLLDFYSFRQTQTALTSYWLIKNGIINFYETPVGGYPWSIPFEFPIYQAIVALFSNSTGVGLDTSGRLISYLFLLLILPYTNSIFKKLDIDSRVSLVFSALLVTSPIYLYWSRTYMIETAALFFTIAAINYFVNICVNGRGYAKFIFFITLGLLQKSTTPSPLFIAIGLCFLVYLIALGRQSGFSSVLSDVYVKRVLRASLMLVVPILITVLWVSYTDQIKNLSVFGSQITSSSLSNWNWGTLSQRFSYEFNNLVLLSRITKHNFFLGLGWIVTLCAIFYNWRRNRKVTVLILVSILFGLAPIYTYTNLHYVHDYYQTANVIYLLAAVSISVVYLPIGNKWMLAVTIVLILVNIILFQTSELSTMMKRNFTDKTETQLAIAKVIKERTEKDAQIVIFGDDWSSVYPYYSERKGFAVPKWYKDYNKISVNPELGAQPGKLGAVVYCPRVDLPKLSDLTSWSDNQNWEHLPIYGCDLFIPYVNK